MIAEGCSDPSPRGYNLLSRSSIPVNLILPKTPGTPVFGSPITSLLTAFANQNAFVGVAGSNEDSN
jgi:hypothetical protein